MPGNNRLTTPPKAITLWRPWDISIVYGPKRMENRTWAVPANAVGIRILIHAGLRYDDRGEAFIRSRWPKLAQWTDDPREAEGTKGKIIGSVHLVGCIEKRDGKPARVVSSVAGEEERLTRFANRIENGSEPWFMGPFAWILGDDVHRFVNRIQISGAQGIWSVHDPKARMQVATEEYRSELKEDEGDENGNEGTQEEEGSGRNEEEARRQVEGESIDRRAQEIGWQGERSGPGRPENVAPCPRLE